MEVGSMSLMAEIYDRNTSVHPVTLKIRSMPPVLLGIDKQPEYNTGMHPILITIGPSPRNIIVCGNIDTFSQEASWITFIHIETNCTVKIDEQSPVP